MSEKYEMDYMGRITEDGEIITEYTILRRLQSQDKEIKRLKEDNKALKQGMINASFTR